MSEQDADRLRRAIAQGQGWPSQPQPAAPFWEWWFWYLNRHPQWLIDHAWGADAAEAADRAWYGL